MLCEADFLTISTVVVCKRHFAVGDQIHPEDVSYLHTLLPSSLIASAIRNRDTSRKWRRGSIGTTATSPRTD